jgi:hypothetical protein
MNNVVSMAIIYAGKNLLHEHCGIFFTKFTALEDFIEKLATLADP